MENTTGTNLNRQIFTIPNILSFLRVLMIPVIVWLYCFRLNYKGAAFVLVLSGLTDVADGFIARHFNMTSDLGKMLDPIADKLTQGITLICLGTRFPIMLWLAAILSVKEIFTGLHSLNVVRKTGTVKSSDWHGKLVTVLLYLTMGVHILWVDIPAAVTAAMSGVCLAMMVFSFIKYLRRNIRQLAESRADVRKAG